MGKAQEVLEEKKINQLLQEWIELPQEKKDEIIRNIINHFLEVSKEDKTKAAIQFIKWISSPEGAMIYPWIWKEPYREVMIDIAEQMLILFSKIPFIR